MKVVKKEPSEWELRMRDCPFRKGSALKGRTIKELREHCDKCYNSSDKTSEFCEHIRKYVLPNMEKESS